MKKRTVEITIKSETLWKAATIGLLAALLLSLALRPGGPVAPTGEEVTADQAATAAINHINENILQGQATATLQNVTEQGGLYVIMMDIEGQAFTSYISKDGQLLFPSAIDISVSTAAVLAGQNATQNATQNQTAPTEEAAQTQRANVSVDDDPVKGSENASVTIIEFSDFQCPFCARFYTETLPLIEENYIKTGKVKLVYRDFPLSSIHPQAQKAAEAAECADEQGEFWEYHDKLFANQQALDTDSLKQYAADLGLNTSTFDDCLDNGDMTAEVQKDFQDGQSYGVTGTPAFFINGIPLTGAQPFGAFKQIIDSELSK